MAKYKVRDLTLTDKIGLCAVAVMGKGVAEAAFLLTHDIKTENKASLGVMVSRWQNDEKAKEFITSVRSGTASAIAADETNDLRTREGLVSQLITATQQASGRDSINGLTTLLKVQGLDKPEEQPEQEKRRYYLPWISSCRSCVLMRTYLEVQKAQKEESNLV